MSPEQAEGQAIDHRSDIYALGVVAYQMCTGKAPFDNVSPLVVLRAHADKAPPAPRELNPDLPESVETVLFKALAKRPDERYQRAGEVARALQVALKTAEQARQQAEKRTDQETCKQATELQAQPISVLELRTRAENLLLEAGIETIGDVLKRLEVGEATLTNLHGFGAKSLADLKENLRGLGFVLPAHVDEEVRIPPQKVQSDTKQKRKSVRRQRQAAEKTLRPLSPWNPLDQFRLLWWILVVPQRFKAYGDTGKDLSRVGGVLTSTLTWSPLLLLMLALGLETLPHPEDTPSYFAFLFFMIFLWFWTLLTTADEFWAAILGVGLVLVGLIGFALMTESVVAAGKVNFLVLGTVFSAAFLLAFIVALIVAKGAVFIVPGGAACSALGLVAYSAFGDLLTGVVRIAALGAVFVAVGFMIFLIVRDLGKSISTGQPSWLAHTTFGILVITYVFLIWFSFLGGWRIFQ
jgi:preprotein translocase subunit Sss1